MWASINGDVADQPVDKQRKRAHRHTPAPADVDRLQLTTGHQLVDGRPSDRQSAGGLSGVTSSRSSVMQDSFMRTSARTVTVLARQRSPEGRDRGRLDNPRVGREVPSRREST